MFRNSKRLERSPRFPSNPYNVSSTANLQKKKQTICVEIIYMTSYYSIQFSDNDSKKRGEGLYYYHIITARGYAEQVESIPCGRRGDQDMRRLQLKLVVSPS